MSKEIVLSGMRPTGSSLHLGNYFGALMNFVRLQEDPAKSCYFFVANWHAFTTLPNPQEVHENVMNVVADYIAAGLDPDRVVIYVQSMVPETAEIALLLSNSIPFGRLISCTTFKEKSAKQEMVTGGLAFYPVLMAADILGVKARWVPVGEDQMQHLEMAREMARHFNKTYSAIFPEPENYVMNPLRVPGLDGSNKMGKSDNNTIQLDHTPEEVWGRLSVAVTDPHRIKKTDCGNPALCNLYEIAEILDKTGNRLGLSLGEMADRCKNARHGCLDCKRILNDAILNLINPIRERKAELLQNKHDLVDILCGGAKKARLRIGETLEEMRDSLRTKF